MTQEEFNTNMQERLTEVESTLKLVLGQVNKLYTKLIGDELSPKGFLSEFDDIKKEVKDLRAFRDKIIWSMSIAATSGGIVGYFIQQFIAYLKIK